MTIGMLEQAACAEYHGREPVRNPRTERRALAVRGRIVWEDGSGRTRTAPIRTRNVSDRGVLLDCISATPVPLYRLVSLRLERAARHDLRLPRVLRQGPVLAAVYRVGPLDPKTGAPSSYALRLLVDPRRLQADEATEARRGDPAVLSRDGRDSHVALAS